jgi:hypothetical protein
LWVSNGPTAYSVVHLLPSGALVTYSAGFSNVFQPHALAYDAASANLFVAVSGGGPGTYTVVLLVPSSGALTQIRPGTWTEPYGLALDAAGALYVADYNYATGTGVVRIVPGGGGPPYTAASYNAGTATYLAAGAAANSRVTAVVVDAALNVYFTMSYPTVGNGIYKIAAPASNASTAALVYAFPASLAQTVGGGALVASGLALDGAGNFFVTSVNSYTAFIVRAPDYASIAPLTPGGYSATLDVKVDINGNVYFASENQGVVAQVRAGTYAPGPPYGGGSLSNPVGLALGCAPPTTPSGSASPSATPTPRPSQ